MQLRPLPYPSGEGERGYKRVKVKALIKCRGRLVVGRQPAKLFGRFRPPWVQFPLPALNITMDYLSWLSDLRYVFEAKEGYKSTNHTEQRRRQCQKRCLNQVLLSDDLKEPVVELGRITYKNSGISVYLPKSISHALHLTKNDKSLVIFNNGNDGFFLIKDARLANTLKPKILDLRKELLNSLEDK